MKNVNLFFNCVGIVGVGLIGSSFALAMKERKYVKEVWGYSCSGRSAKKALELGIIDKQVDELAELAKSCDFILVSTPVLAIPETLKTLSLYVGRDTVITDGGSVKKFVKECANYFKYDNFIGAHPIAGTEKSGPEAGFSSLFDGSTCIITPVNESKNEKFDIVRRVWEALGMNVVLMTPEEHDFVMAEVSHMPHAIAFSLVSAVKDKYFNERKVTSFAGGGFRDFTRIAKSDVTMWTDIFISNRENVISAINDFKNALDGFCDALLNKDRKKLESFIYEARHALLRNEKK